MNDDRNVSPIVGPEAPSSQHGGADKGALWRLEWARSKRWILHMLKATLKILK